MGDGDKNYDLYQADMLAEDEWSQCGVCDEIKPNDEFNWVDGEWVCCDLMNEAMYRSYRANRLRAPNLEPKSFKVLYKDWEMYEKRFVNES